MKKIIQSRWIEFSGLVVAIIAARTCIIDFIKDLSCPIAKYGLFFNDDLSKLIHISTYILIFCSVICGYKIVKDLLKYGSYKALWVFFVVTGITFVLILIENVLRPTTLLIELLLMMILIVVIVNLICRLTLLAYYSDRANQN